jgi:uncharacterized iron-regulated membrane protein
MSNAPDWLSNKTLFRIHGWLGLNFGLLLFVVCLSGTIAVFSWEIDWLIDPAMRAETEQVAADAAEAGEPGPSASGVNWTAIRAGVAEAYPYHEASFMVAPRHEGFAALVYATDPAGRSVKLWVHPQTGEVQQRGNFWTVQRFFRSFHRRMFVPNPWGILWVTIFALTLLASAVTGILFYRGWYRNLFRLRWKDVRLLFSDGHRLAGVWSLAFTAIIVATGVWYAVEMAAPASGPKVRGITEAQKVERGPAPEVLPLSEQVARAKAAFPGFQATDVIPGTPSRVTQIRGQADAWFVRPRANTVRVDPVTGEVLSVQRATELSAYHRWSDMADPLHFGTFGGLWSQALWFIFGLILSSLALTGGWLWHDRAEKKAIAAGANTKHPRWGYVAAAVPVVALLASGVFGYLELDRYMQAEAPKRVQATAQPVGPWQAHVVALEDSSSRTAGAASVRVAFRNDQGAPANVKAARLHWAGQPDTTGVGLHPYVPVTRALERGPRAASDAAPSTGGSAGATRLVLSATAWDGTTHQDTLAVPGTEAAPRAATYEAGLPVPPVPVAVWIVIAAFVALTLAIVAAWLYVAQTTRTPDEAKAEPKPKTQAATRPAAATADLPTPGAS